MLPSRVDGFIQCGYGTDHYACMACAYTQWYTYADMSHESHCSGECCDEF